MPGVHDKFLQERILERQDAPIMVLESTLRPALLFENGSDWAEEPVCKTRTFYQRRIMKEFPDNFTAIERLEVLNRMKHWVKQAEWSKRAEMRILDTDSGDPNKIIRVEFYLWVEEDKHADAFIYTINGVTTEITKRKSDDPKCYPS